MERPSQGVRRPSGVVNRGLSALQVSRIIRRQKGRAVCVCAHNLVRVDSVQPRSRGNKVSLLLVAQSTWGPAEAVSRERRRDVNGPPHMRTQDRTHGPVTPYKCILTKAVDGQALHLASSASWDYCRSAFCTLSGWDDTEFACRTSHKNTLTITQSWTGERVQKPSRARYGERARSAVESRAGAGDERFVAEWSRPLERVAADLHVLLISKAWETVWISWHSSQGSRHRILGAARRRQTEAYPGDRVD